MPDPGISEPKGTMRVPQLRELQSVTAEGVRRAMADELTAMARAASRSFLDDLTRGIGAALLGRRPEGFGHVADGFDGLLGGIGAALTGRATPGFAPVVEGFEGLISGLGAALGGRREDGFLPVADAFEGLLGGIGAALGGRGEAPFAPVSAGFDELLAGVGAALRGQRRRGFDPVAEAADDLLTGIGAALAGDGAGRFRPVADGFTDGQAALVREIAALNGVRGYASAYQAVNINLAWGGLDNERMLPFEKPLGPHRGAHVAEWVPGIIFDEAGLWTVHVLAHARRTAFSKAAGASDGVRIWAEIIDDRGRLWSRATVDESCEQNEASLTLSVPVVIPRAGFRVRVRCWSARWRWWDGGTEFSRLSVVKTDSRAINPGRQTVPDEAKH